MILLHKATFPTKLIDNKKECGTKGRCKCHPDAPHNLNSFDVSIGLCASECGHCGGYETACDGEVLGNQRTRCTALLCHKEKIAYYPRLYKVSQTMFGLELLLKSVPS